MSTNDPNPKPSLHYRPFLIALMALIILAIAGNVNGQELTQLASATAPVAQKVPVSQKVVVQFNNTTQLLPRAESSPGTTKHTVTDIVAGVGASEQQSRAQHESWSRYTSSRPKYAEMKAELANFDADADPDGWRVELVLRDAHDRPVAMRSTARFELMPRVPTADFHNYVDADIIPITWSKDVKFDERSVAHFKLPLREQLKPLFGWPSSIYPETGMRSNIYGRNSRYRSGIHGRAGRSQRLGTAVTRDFRNTLGKPTVGELRVRVSVPTEGVFSAVVPIQIRPSVLVDTNWPYR